MALMRLKSPDRFFTVQTEAMRQDSRLDGSSHGFEKVDSRLTIEAGEMACGANCPLPQFIASQVQIDHPVLVDLPNLNHGPGGQTIQEKLGGGSGFESG